MIKKILVMISTLMLLSAPALAFGLTSTDLSTSTCPSNTALFVAQISNTGTSTEAYTLALSGSASGWASVAPAGLALGPSQAQDIYIYITPSTNAQPGNYGLKLTVSSGSSTKNLDFSYEVESCHDILLTAQNNELAVCSGNSANYILNLRNDGQWRDTYDLVASGAASSWSTVSHNSVTLSPGESQQLVVTVTPPRSEIGVYSLALAATSRNVGTVVAQSLAVVSNSCYNYDMVASESYVSFCDNTEAKIPITITNSGSENNVYNLDLTGTAWSVLDKDSMSVFAGSSGTFNLVLTPGFGDVGTSKFIISSSASQGDTTDSAVINANILTCRDTSLDIESSSTEICPETSDTIDISLTNAGRFEENYALTVDGPSWAELSDNSVSLASGESTDLQLTLAPSIRSGGSSSDIKIIARSQNVGNTQSSDTIKVKVLSGPECYNFGLKSEFNEVVIAYGESALIPIIVTNTGSQSALYEFSVSGDGAKMAQINPGAVEVEGNSAEGIYLYISVPRDVAKEDYVIYVAAQSGELRETTSIRLTISDEVPSYSVGPTSAEGISGSIISLYSSASNFVVNYWYVFPGLLVLLVILLIFSRVRESKSWMKDLELLEQELEVSENKLKKTKSTQPTIFKRFTNWLMEEDVEIVTKSKVKKVVSKKSESGALSKLWTWLMEEDKPKEKPSVKSRPKIKTQPNFLVRAWTWLTEDNEKVEIITTRAKSDKPILEEVKDFLFEEVPITDRPIKKKAAKKDGLWNRVTNWLMEEDKSNEKVVKKVKPTKKKAAKKDGLWTKFIKWLEEEDEFPKSKPVRKVQSKKVVKKDGLWTKFINWLEENDEPASKKKVVKKSKSKKEKSLWKKFVDWLEEED
jgi:uncharacterized membrane protein